MRFTHSLRPDFERTRRRVPADAVDLGHVITLDNTKPTLASVSISSSNAKDAKVVRQVSSSSFQPPRDGSSFMHTMSFCVGMTRARRRTCSDVQATKADKITVTIMAAENIELPTVLVSDTPAVRRRAVRKHS